MVLKNGLYFFIRGVILKIIKETIMGLHRDYEDNKSYPERAIDENEDDLRHRKDVRKMLENRLERKRLKEELEDELDDKFDWSDYEK